MHRHPYSSALAILLALAAGCGRPAEPTAYIARVGEAYLTEADLPPADSAGTAARREAVDAWVTTQLLYQEALRRGFGEREELRDQIVRTEQQLTVNAYLDEELFAEDAVDEASVEAYYASAGDVFTLRGEVALVSTAAFDERDAANQLRTRVLGGIPWGEALRQMRDDPALGRHLLDAATRRYVTAATLYPEQLWKLARTMKPDDVSFVVATDAGYHVLLLHRFQAAGTRADLEYVREEIRNRVLIEQRRVRYRSLLAEIRQRHRVEIRAAAPGK